MVGVTGSASTIDSLSGGFVGKSDPVDIATGQFVYTKTDLALPDILPIALTRTYIANDSHSRSFGIGTTNSLSLLMVPVSASIGFHPEPVLPMLPMFIPVPEAHFMAQ